jgi:thiamine-phosphate pyrophosphorylase
MPRRPHTFWPPLYWIADAALAGDTPLDRLAREAIAGGLRLFQYRDKTSSSRDRYPVAAALAAVAREGGATFLINDDIDLALGVEADGVHLGQDDFPVATARRILGPERLIGCSAYTLDQARAAEADGADYLGVGPIHPSSTKMARPALGCEALRDICVAACIPVYAIGGITIERCGEAMRSGARGVAVASGLFKGDIRTQTEGFLQALHR